MKFGLSRLVAMGALALCFTGEAFADWTKTYVVEWNEAAMYFGGTGGTTSPGTDCPKGSNPEPDWIKVLMDAGYTKQEATWLRDPSTPLRIPNHGLNQMAFRGKDRANVYAHPESTPDPKLTPVTGKISEGFDLDDNKSTGFVSPDGRPGIDNEFYRALGCWGIYRGPARVATNAVARNEEMREGRWTIVIVVAGAGADPMNDANVRVGFYTSADAMVKDGGGNITRDYTFDIKPDAKFEAIFEAKTVKGEILSTKSSDEIWLREPTYTRELQLLKARISLRMEPDGSLKGFMGGYRPWFDVYRGWIEARGSVIEQLGWVELPGVWYTLKRHADYAAPGSAGEKTHISYAMRVDAVPAYVMTPDGTKQVDSVRSYKAEAPPSQGRIPAVPFYKRVVDGLVLNTDGTLLGGPNTVIPPPESAALASSVPGKGGN